MNYLIYVEFAAENLQFYLWHRDYVKRFNAAPASDIALAPEWTKQMETEVATKLQREVTDKAARAAAQDGAAAADMFKGTDFDKETAVENVADAAAAANPNPFVTPPRTRSGDERESTFAPSVLSNANTSRSHANDAIAAAGASTPCTFPALATKPRSTPAALPPPQPSIPPLTTPHSVQSPQPPHLHTPTYPQPLLDTSLPLTRPLSLPPQSPSSPTARRSRASSRRTSPTAARGS